MCEQVEKKILFCQQRYIDPGDQTKVCSTDGHYSEVPHYVYVELCQYDGDVFIMETFGSIAGEDIHTRQLLPIGTRSYDAVRIAIINFDMYAKRVDENKAGEEL